MFVAAIAKLYPVFGLPAYLLLGNRRAAITAVASLGAFAAYLALTYRDLLIIASTATQGQYYSYGARILLGAAYHSITGQNWAGESSLAQAAALSVSAVLAGCLWVWFRRRLAPLAVTNRPRHLSC